MDFLIAIVGILLLILVVWVLWRALDSALPKFPASTAIARRNPNSVSPPPVLDDLIALLMVGAIGFAAYKLITSGALKKLLAEIAELPIEVNGQRKSIGTATRDDAYIEGLLRSAVMAKLKTIAEHDDQSSSFSSNTPQAAMDVAQMLRDALNQRMRQMPHRS